MADQIAGTWTNREAHPLEMRDRIIAAKDRRIAELEAALKRVCAEFQKVLDENERAGVSPSAYVNAEFGSDYPALDAALAAAKQEALETAADHFDSRPERKLSSSEVYNQLIDLALEVKP